MVGELELAHRLLRVRNDGARILAVTGTNGKSTTTDLLAHLLKAAGLPAIACGNLGTPLMAAMEGQGPGTRYALECSSYQLETIRDFHAEGAVILNLTPDHLARHGTMEAYLDAKLRIFERQEPSAVRLTPAADPTFDAFAPGHGRSCRFGWGAPKGPGAWCDPEGLLWLVDDQGRAERLLHRRELRIPGDHNVENALAAAVLANHGGAGAEALREGLKTYPGLAHRMVLCGEKAGIKVYNDSKGTNVDATVTAIKALPGPLILLLGGQDKGTPYEPLRRFLDGKLRHLIFLGEAIPKLEAELGDLPHTTLQPFDEAVRMALRLAQPGDQVLLSPACASFDQFKNFEERGDHFEALVQGLAAGAGIRIGTRFELQTGTAGMSGRRTGMKAGTTAASWPRFLESLSPFARLRAPGLRLSWNARGFATRLAKRARPRRLGPSEQGPASFLCPRSSPSSPFVVVQRHRTRPLQARPRLRRRASTAGTSGGGIHAQADVGRLGHADGDAGGQGPQLLQHLEPLEGVGRELREGAQGLGAVGVEAQVALEVPQLIGLQPGAEVALEDLGVAQVGDGAAAEVEGPLAVVQRPPSRRWD